MAGSVERACRLLENQVMAADSKSGRDDRERENPLEWEGGDPPCWAHLFEDVLTVPIEATGQTGEKSDGPTHEENQGKR